MKKEFTCFFTGHRAIPFGKEYLIREKLREMIEYLIENKGVNTFISGAALGFDTIAAEEVIKIKEKYPHIKLYLYIPCRDQSRKWKEEDKLKWKILLKSVDDYIYVTDDNYVNGCMHKRNRKMADDGLYCISYCTKESGGTAYTLSYADRIGDIIYNINV